MKTDIGLLVFRVFVGLSMCLGHGWQKLTGFTDIAPGFPDPIGLGSTVSLALVVFAEAFCSIAVALGLKTRFAVIPLIINMSVAVFVFHSADPFQKKELAALYLVSFAAIFLLGPGKFSLDSVFKLEK